MYIKICLIIIVLFVFIGTPRFVLSPTLPYKMSNWISNKDVVLQKVIDCESQGNIYAFNPKDSDGFPKYGLLQFHLPTFLNWAEAAGIDNPDVWNPEQQLQLYKWAAKNGRLRSW